eukprot:Lankesteria_metandrocarpae@DN5369_c1_g1_i1.p1
MYGRAAKLAELSASEAKPDEASRLYIIAARYYESAKQVHKAAGCYKLGGDFEKAASLVETDGDTAKGEKKVELYKMACKIYKDSLPTVKSEDKSRLQRCILRVSNNLVKHCAEGSLDMESAVSTSLGVYEDLDIVDQSKANLQEKSGQWEQAAKTYLELKEHEGATRCYKEAGKFELAAELYEGGRLLNFKEAERLWVTSKNYKKAADAALKQYTRAGTDVHALRAAAYYSVGLATSLGVQDDIPLLQEQIQIDVHAIKSTELIDHVFEQIDLTMPIRLNYPVIGVFAKGLVQNLATVKKFTLALKWYTLLERQDFRQYWLDYQLCDLKFECLKGIRRYKDAVYVKEAQLTETDYEDSCRKSQTPDTDIEESVRQWKASILSDMITVAGYLDDGYTHQLVRKYKQFMSEKDALAHQFKSQNFEQFANECSKLEKYLEAASAWALLGKLPECGKNLQKEIKLHRWDHALAAHVEHCVLVWSDDCRHDLVGTKRPPRSYTQQITIMDTLLSKLEISTCSPQSKIMRMIAIDRVGTAQCLINGLNDNNYNTIGQYSVPAYTLLTQTLCERSLPALQLFWTETTIFSHQTSCSHFRSPVPNNMYAFVGTLINWEGAMLSSLVEVFKGPPNDIFITWVALAYGLGSDLQRVGVKQYLPESFCGKIYIGKDNTLIKRVKQSFSGLVAMTFKGDLDELKTGILNTLQKTGFLEYEAVIGAVFVDVLSRLLQIVKDLVKGNQKLDSMEMLNNWLLQSENIDLQMAKEREWNTVRVALAIVRDSFVNMFLEISQQVPFPTSSTLANAILRSRQDMLPQFLEGWYPEWKLLDTLSVKGFYPSSVLEYYLTNERMKVAHEEMCERFSLMAQWYDGLGALIDKCCIPTYKMHCYNAPPRNCRCEMFDHTNQYNWDGGASAYLALDDKRYSHPQYGIGVKGAEQLWFMNAQKRLQPLWWSMASQRYMGTMSVSMKVTNVTEERVRLCWQQQRQTGWYSAHGLRIPNGFGTIYEESERGSDVRLYSTVVQAAMHVAKYSNLPFPLEVGVKQIINTYHLPDPFAVFISVQLLWHFHEQGQLPEVEKIVNSRMPLWVNLSMIITAANHQDESEEFFRSQRQKQMFYLPNDPQQQPRVARHYPVDVHRRGGPKRP